MTATFSSTVSVFRRSAALVVGLTVLSALGCSATHSEPQLTLRSSTRNQTFSEQFARAYVTHGRDGDTDVVMTDRAAEGEMDGVRDAAPVRQVMHIRVLWNAKSDMASQHVSASNATIHWYVIGNTPATSGDVLEYAGTAFILVDSADGGASLQIRSASVRPVACRGELCDPIGSSTFQGSFRATENRQRVRQALTAIRTAVAAGTPLPVDPTSHNKPESPSSLVTP